MRPNRLPVVADGYPLGAQDLNRVSEAQEFAYKFVEKPSWLFQSLFVGASGDEAKKWGPSEYRTEGEWHMMHWHRYLYYELYDCSSCTMTLNDDTITVLSGVNGAQSGFVDLNSYTRFDVYNIRITGYARVNILYECPQNTGTGLPYPLPNAKQDFSTPPTYAEFNLEVANLQALLDDYTLQVNGAWRLENRYHGSWTDSDYETEELEITWYSITDRNEWLATVRMHDYLYFRMQCYPDNESHTFQIVCYHTTTSENSDYKLFDLSFDQDDGDREVRIAYDMNRVRANDQNYSGQVENTFNSPVVAIPAVGSRINLFLHVHGRTNGMHKLLMFHEQRSPKDYTQLRN